MTPAELLSQCDACGEPMPGAYVCNDCVPALDLCDDCGTDHDKWHDAKDNQPDDETGMDPYAMRGISRNDFF